MADKAHITPNVLKWARESAKIAEETAARKVAVTKEKIKEWENGESQPTIKQAQKLAKVYKRPFAVFFLPDIPKDFQLLNDFRKNGSKPLTTSSIFIIREIQQKQTWISEANKENNEPKLPFVGRYSLNDNPKDVAADILNTLSLNPSNYQFENPIKEWIESAERNGIFVSRTSFIHSKLKLDSEELQGFAIADPFAPFIFINSDDWQAPQLFTLVHELSHIWIAESGISNDANLEEINIGKFHPIELFCNEVAANVLMPEELIISMRASLKLNSKELFSVAKKIGVSSYALLVRLLSLKLISKEEYNKLKKEADIALYEFKQRENEKKLKAKVSSGGPSYFLLQLNRNSRLFTQTVLDAFRGGTIEATLASNLLNVQTNKFNKLEAQIYK
jgi:Zn-dependent peptidase ImmA (M78 family)/DNA-binding XRE family transcriptional regulator